MKQYQLTGEHLKWIAIVAMTLDHIAWVFVDTNTFFGQFLHFIGRLTAPIMCFFLVNGFYLSKNRQNYALRLLIFAIISQIPFTMLTYPLVQIIAEPLLVFKKFNILFNLLLSLLALWVWHGSYSKFFKVIITGCFLFVSLVLDWQAYIPIFVLILAYFHPHKNKQLLAYSLVSMFLLLLTEVGLFGGMPVLVMSWFPLGILLVPFIWYYYNGVKGYSIGGRYFFYVYYPLHMLILALISNYFGSGVW